MYDGETAERQMLCRFFIYLVLYYNKENTIKRTFAFFFALFLVFCQKNRPFPVSTSMESPVLESYRVLSVRIALPLGSGSNAPADSSA